MGDIKLKKGTGILFVMAVLFISSLLYLHMETRIRSG